MTIGLWSVSLDEYFALISVLGGVEFVLSNNLLLSYQ
jgi:hypothetical protein